MKSSQQFDDLIDLLNLEPQVESGNDDYIFGHYLEFPSASRIGLDLIPNVLEILGVPLPFGLVVEACSLSWLRDLNSFTRELVLGALGEPTVTMTDAGEFLLAFPSLRVDSAEVVELVDRLLPPTLYEPELPDDQRYWQPDADDLYGEPDDELLDLYRSRPVTCERLVGELRSLRATFDATGDSTVRKAILLACFSLVESFTRQRSLQRAPRFPRSPETEGLVLGLLRREVQNDERRQKVVNALEPGKAWEKQIPSWKLRNALAHDIDGVSIECGKVAFVAPKQQQKDSVHTMESETIFENLIEYVRNNLGR